MPQFESVINRLRSQGTRGVAPASAPAMLIVTIVYLVAVLSGPLQAPQRLVWLAAYPVVVAETTRIGYGHLFVKSLWILPIAVAVGIFNPFIDTATAFTVGGVKVSEGWVSFTSIILRGLLAMQGVLLMTDTCGFAGVVAALYKFGCPSVLTTQLTLTHRYITVIATEAATMHRARLARGYGRKSYSPGMWGTFIGQLLIRSWQRASCIHRAMLARGFKGTMPVATPMAWNTKSWIWAAVWCIVIVQLCLIDFSTWILHFAS